MAHHDHYENESKLYIWKLLLFSALYGALLMHIGCGDTNIIMPALPAPMTQIQGDGNGNGNINGNGNGDGNGNTNPTPTPTATPVSGAR